MIKKLIIIFTLSILLYGCSLNDLNSKNNIVKLTSSDIKQLVGLTYNDVEKIYGPPDRFTYYVFDEDLSSINENYITFRDFNHHFILKASYEINNSNNYIIIWYKDNKVIDAVFDENDDINEYMLCKELSSSPIIINCFKSSSYLDNNSTLDTYKKFLNKDIDDFNKEYNLNFPKVCVSIKNNNNLIYFYNINKDKNHNNICILRVYNKKIVDIDIINSSNLCESIIKIMKKGDVSK